MCRSRSGRLRKWYMTPRWGLLADNKALRNLACFASSWRWGLIVIQRSRMYDSFMGL